MKKSLLLLSILLPFLFGGAVLAAEPQQSDPVLGDDNLEAGLKYLTLRAEQGDSDSQHDLGLIYEQGAGVPQDYKVALKWYTMAAKQGDASAQGQLGVMYAHGEGIPQDYKGAAKWFTLAAEQGTADAQYNLGIMYANGKGVLQDDIRAHMWFNIAASNNDSSAPKNRDLVTKLMSSADIAKAQKLARECLESNYQAC